MPYFWDGPNYYADVSSKNGPVGKRVRVGGIEPDRDGSFWARRYTAEDGSSGFYLGKHTTEAEARSAVIGGVIEASRNWIQCRECLRPESPGSRTKEAADKILSYGVCINCLYWLEWIESATKNPLMFISSGRAYTIGREPSAGELRRNQDCYGFGGAGWKVSINNGEWITTHNLWTQGEVPKHFRERLPDNAELKHL